MARQLSASLCSGRTAYEVKAHKKIDLLAAAKIIKDTKVAAAQIMIFDFLNAEISLFASGRMLIKKVKDEEEALFVANKLLDILEPEK
jgi:hypothetical protein